MPNQGAETTDLRRVTCFGKLDMLQGYWQAPLATKAQEVFTVTTPEGLIILTRAVQGVLKATLPTFKL